MECAQCPLKARYDKNPKSLLGRFWKFHTKFCPKWKLYVNGLDETDRQEIRDKYGV